MSKLKGNGMQNGKKYSDFCFSNFEEYELIDSAGSHCIIRCSFDESIFMLRHANIVKAQEHIIPIRSIFVLDEKHRRMEQKVREYIKD